MRCAFLSALLLLSACGEAPGFDESWQAQGNELAASARAMEAEINGQIAAANAADGAPPND